MLKEKCNCAVFFFWKKCIGYLLMLPNIFSQTTIVEPEITDIRGKYRIYWNEITIDFAEWKQISPLRWELKICVNRWLSPRFLGQVFHSFMIKISQWKFHKVAHRARRAWGLTSMQFDPGFCFPPPLSAKRSKSLAKTKSGVPTTWK